MFVLNRKSIYIFLSCLLLLTLGCQVKNTKTLETQETVALPVNNKIIILDAGHGR